MLGYSLGVFAMLIAGWIGYRLWQYELLEPYREGVSAVKAGDYQLALTKLRPLVKAGNVDAQRMLGEMYAAGWGVPVDDIQASIWFRRAECRCDEPGQAELDTGLNLLDSKSDKGAAVKWIQRAAEAGHPRAQMLLTDQRTLREKGLSVDPAVSDYWRQALQAR
jgi:TPR repeat protein